MLNQQIHNYKIISLLGEGGMANVYLVEHLTLGQNFALKLLKDEFVQHPNIRKRFLAEARNLAKMQHSNVIKVTDLIDAGDIVAFVMEYIEGVSLEDYISTRSPLSHETIEKLFLQMINAVEYVHSQGLIHRDIKPSNFMVTPDDSVKLLDFGIAKNLNDGAVDYTKTSMAQQMGTPMYMSPEQVRNTAEITPQTDIYSLGVVLWQMVTNKKPYDSERLTLPEIQVAIMKEPLPLTNTGWDDVIEFATSKATYDRCSDFDELKELISFVEIDEFLSRQEATALAEVVYEKGFKEIDKIVDEVAQNRKQREKKMQALSPASTSKINQKYIWIGVIILIMFFALFYWYKKSTIIPKINEKVDFEEIKSVEEKNNNVEKVKVTHDSQNKRNSKSNEITKQDEPVIEKSNQINKQNQNVIEKSNNLIVGQDYQGGRIFYIDDSGKHGKILVEKEFGEFDWENGNSTCENLVYNGYDDWFMPSKVELNILYIQNRTFKFLKKYSYWSSTTDIGKRSYSWGQDFNDGEQGKWLKSYKGHICPIREF
jgi:serine/threonine protein kinase